MHNISRFSLSGWRAIFEIFWKPIDKEGSPRGADSADQIIVSFNIYYVALNVPIVLDFPYLA
jgi:hypothetical protein